MPRISHLVIAFALLLISPAASNAQQPKLPDDRPLLASMPASARWLITLPEEPHRPKAQAEEAQKAQDESQTSERSSSAEEDDGTLAEAEAAYAPDVFPKTILVTKIGINYHEAFTWSDGGKSERWYLQSLSLADSNSIYGDRQNRQGYKLCLQMRPGAGRDEMPTGVDPLDSYFRNLDKGPFPELSWIKKEDYKGETMLNGRKALIFEGKQTIVFDDGSETYRARAAIDAATRLPVIFEKDGLRRTYKFLPPPESEMKPDGVFLKRIMQIRDQVKELTRMPARP